MMVHFGHGEADVTIVLDAAKSGQSMICILSDGTDVLILLVYWVNLVDMQCKVQMEPWGGSVLEINATYDDLGQKCLQLPGMHTLSCFDTASYPYDKGNVTALIFNSSCGKHTLALKYITQFGWAVLLKATLLHLIQCQCKAQGK